MEHQFDVLIVADARFQGGTTAAMVADVTALAAMGARIGLFFVRSAYLDDSRDPPHPAALGLLDLDAVTRVTPDMAVQADIAFLHHPMIFFRGIEEHAEIRANKSVVVCHHPPFRADGSLEYDPMTTRRRIRKALQLDPWFAPVSGAVRAQLQSFAPLIHQTTADWPNIFDTNAWSAGPPIFSQPTLTIGRHGRPDGLKWPETGAEINSALPASDTVKVRVLGCPVAALQSRGADLDAWDICAFGEETPLAFLHSLDVFAYHYHPHWVEAFGRTIAEAALTERLCLLDPRLEATFGDMALYCVAEDVPARLEHLRADPATAQAQARKGAQIARDRYSHDSVAARFDQLHNDTGSTARDAATATPLATFRKLAGLYRRQRAEHHKDH